MHGVSQLVKYSKGHFPSKPMLTYDVLHRTPHHLAAQSGCPGALNACSKLPGAELLDGRGYSLQNLTDLGAKDRFGALSVWGPDLVTPKTRCASRAVSVQVRHWSADGHVLDFGSLDVRETSGTSSCPPPKKPPTHPPIPT